MAEVLQWNLKSPEGEIARNEITRIIEEIESGGEVIGKGLTADVLISDRRPDVCLKIISRKEAFRHGAHHEVELLEYAKAHGIAVPQAHGSVETSEADYIFMERITGHDIRTLMEQDLIGELPEKFNFKTFFEKLRGQVKKMNDARLYHRNLHEGNIMVDHKGNPVIIDFGTGAVHHVASEDPYKRIDAKGELVVYPHDDIKVTEAYRTLGSYLKSRGYFDQNQRR